MNTEHTPSRYRWSWKGVTFDFYRLCEILGLKSQPQIHAVKKLIRAGQSIKSTTQDIDESIDALNRWKEMIKEDERDTAPDPSFTRLSTEEVMSPPITVKDEGYTFIEDKGQ